MDGERAQSSTTTDAINRASESGAPDEVYGVVYRELKRLAGLSVEQTGEVMGNSARRIKRDWRGAKAWLYGRLGGDQEGVR